MKKNNEDNQIKIINENNSNNNDNCNIKEIVEEEEDEGKEQNTTIVEKPSILKNIQSFLATLGHCFEILCYDCCGSSSSSESSSSSRKKSKRHGKYGKLPTSSNEGESSATRVRLGFQGKDMWIETQNLNFHQTFGRYSVLMDEKDRIIPFTKNGELTEELNPDMKYKIVANRFGTSEDKWKQFKEAEKIKLKKLQQPKKLNTTVTTTTTTTPPKSPSSLSPRSSPTTSSLSTFFDDENINSRNGSNNSSSIDTIDFSLNNNHQNNNNNDGIDGADVEIV